jgi:hypothetical protein
MFISRPLNLACADRTSGRNRRIKIAINNLFMLLVLIDEINFIKNKKFYDNKKGCLKS